MEIKFKKEDYDKWTKFRNSSRSTISGREFDLVCDLHSRYKKHSFYKPCTCNPREIKRWITDLNNIYKEGL
jgi:hypothetical protein|tara:strand:+ start:1108 stop:1320 length:213 start_codon:yes stop_codon:yes gene_type:complete